VDTLTADLRVPLRSFDVELRLDVEGTVALVGPSGAGKSTVLRAVAGLVRPAVGRIALGNEVWFDEHTWRRPEDRPVGMLFQHYALFPHLSVRENVRFGARGDVAPLLERFGLGPLADAKPA